MAARMGLLGLLLIIGIGVAVAMLITDNSPSEVTYVTSEATVGPLVETVTATGTLQALLTIEVGSQLSGRIAELLVDFNDTARKGQPVASLDRQSYEARLSEAGAALEMARASVNIKRAELERALAELEDANAQIAVLEAQRDGASARYDAAVADAERSRSLSERGVMTAENLSEAEVRKTVEAAALREAEARLAVGRIRVTVAHTGVARQEADLQNGIANIPQREALLDLAKVELERTVIRAPIDGMVIKRNVSEGQTVAASLEAPTLFTIAQDLGEMELIARIDETDIGRILPGQQTSFTVDAYPGRDFTGKVVQVRKSPEVIQNVVTYPVVIRTDNTDLALLPGMTASIRIVVMQTDPLLKVPATALAFVPSAPPQNAARAEAANTTVWLFDGSDQLREIAVETGARDRAQVAITGPQIEVGMRVVTGEVAVPEGRSLFGLRLGF
jgi:HlyD family secretion protein